MNLKISKLLLKRLSGGILNRLDVKIMLTLFFYFNIIMHHNVLLQSLPINKDCGLRILCRLLQVIAQNCRISHRPNYSDVLRFGKNFGICV